jgi:hypothetical protein
MLMSQAMSIQSDHQEATLYVWLYMHIPFGGDRFRYDLERAYYLDDDGLPFGVDFGGGD